MLKIELVKISYDPESHLLIVSTPYKHMNTLCLTIESVLEETRKILEEYWKEISCDT